MIHSPRTLRTNDPSSRGRQQKLTPFRCRGSAVCIIATRGEKRHKILSADEFVRGAAIMGITDDGYRTAAVGKRRARQRLSQHLWTIPNNSPELWLSRAARKYTNVAEQKGTRYGVSFSPSRTRLRLLVRSIDTVSAPTAGESCVSDGLPSDFPDFIEFSRKPPAQARLVLLAVGNPQAFPRIEPHPARVSGNDLC